LTATLRGLEGLREIVIGNDTGLKAKLDKHKEGIGSLKEQLRAVTKQIAKAKEPLPGSAQNQLDGIRRALQEFLGRSHDPDTYAERLTDCELRLKELQLDQPTTGPKGLEQLKVALRQEQNDAQLQVSRAGQLDERIKTIKAKYADLRKHKRCPTCGTAGKHLTAALNIAEKKELDDVSGLLREAEMMREAAHERLEEVGNKLVAAEEYWQKREALELMLGDLKDEGKLIELWKQHDLLVEKAQAEGQMYDLEALEGRRYDIQCELEDAEESAVEWEKELAEIGYKRSQRKQLAEIERRLAEAEAGWEKQNKHVHELEALRARLTAMSMEPILKTLGIFTAAIFDEPLSLEGSELGRMVGSRWVPLSQFSGSEQAVAVAALSCALKADPKRQNLVLADELSSFDDVHLGQFLKNVAAAIQAGVIEQFIGFSIPRKTIKNLPQTVSLRAIGK
jgi:hypothetical protein